MTRRSAPDPLAHQGTLQAHLMLLAHLRSPEKPPGWNWGIFWDKDQDAPDEVEIARLEAHIRGMHGFPSYRQEEPTGPTTLKPTLEAPQHASAAGGPEPAEYVGQLQPPMPCPWDSRPHLHIKAGDELMGIGASA